MPNGHITTKRGTINIKKTPKIRENINISNELTPEFVQYFRRKINFSRYFTKSFHAAAAARVDNFLHSLYNNTIFL